MAAAAVCIFLFLLHIGQGIVTGQQAQFDRPQQLNLHQYFVDVSPRASSTIRATECNLPPNSPETVYHAPARFVPFPAVDSALKREFLLLFHREGNPGHTHFTPHDNITQPGQPGQNGTASLIDPAIIQQINDLCGRNTLFYSFSPRHMMAIQLLTRIFMQQRTPQDLLNLSRVELSRHEINPRVWYYALLSTFLRRADLSGYQLAGPIDATPDLYVPWTIIQHAISKSTSRPLPEPQMNTCTTAIGVVSNDVSFPEPPGQPGQSGQQNNNAAASSSLNNVFGFSNNQNFGYGPPQRQSPLRPTQQRRQQPPPPQQRPRQREGQLPPECILFNGTNGAPGAENLLWYLREDVQVNEHHWFWHQYYPLTAQRHPDRRGEVFYFMHHHLVARYNAERLSNGLPIETALDLRLNGNIGPGYFSDLNDRQSGMFWTPRLSNMPLSDISHDQNPDFQLSVPMDNLTATYATLLSHTSQGFLFANRSTQPGQPPQQFPVSVNNLEGFAHVGNTFEASEDLSLNTGLYTANGVHNLCHIVVGLATDPDFRCQRPTGVMADTSVTMRDPAFYKVHSFVDDFFESAKATVPAYTPEGGEFPLRWRGVTLRTVETMQRGEFNLLRTFWSIRRFPLEEGIDGSIHDGDIDSLVCQQHLNHEPFQFRFVVDVDSCAQSQSNLGTIRLFMAPRFDLDGRRFSMQETRRLMFQLDAFPVELRRGRNVITRNSGDSSSTRPWSRSLAEMLRDPDNARRPESCGCGWPEHLYIPKGRPEGMQFDLFAMITNWDEDRVDDRPEDLRVPEPCVSPYLFCGIPNRRYPDRRPMGYPFDRQAYSVNDQRGISRQVETLEEYVANVGNMMGNVVTIAHLDTVVQTTVN